MSPTRREFLQGAAKAVACAGFGAELLAQVPGERPGRAEGVTVLNPRGRVPLSFIIDDSTCLVNLNRFAIPQFAAAWGDRRVFRQPWRQMPVEIPCCA